MIETVRLIECPRDAMQGWKNPIPTSLKIAYLNALLEVGFDTLDFGSFVSPRAIPQLADTKAVLAGLNPGSATRLLAIVANLRGAEEACSFETIHAVGFPFSLSETFQQRNTNSSIAESLDRVKEILHLCARHNKQLVVYLSMGFGNPYGDPYSKELVFEWAEVLGALGVQTLSLADTVGLATAEQVHTITEFLVTSMPGTEIGVHLHSTHQNWEEKLAAAYTAGCRRFDGALKGIGGCPMAGNDLVGNMNTEWMMQYFRAQHALPACNEEALQKSLALADLVFAS